MRDIRESKLGPIDNPHITDWWSWEILKVYKEVYLASDATDWHWNQAK